MSPQWTPFQHELNTTELFAYLLGTDASGRIYTAYADLAFWHIVSENQIDVDVKSGTNTFEMIRLLIWKIAEP